MNVEFFLARSDTALYFFDYDNHVFELDTADLDLSWRDDGWSDEPPPRSVPAGAIFRP
jgi:hypothetical protein